MAIFFNNSLRTAWIISRNRKVPHFDDDNDVVNKVDAKAKSNYISCTEMFDWYNELAKSHQTAK